MFLKIADSNTCFFVRHLDACLVVDTSSSKRLYCKLLFLDLSSISICAFITLIYCNIFLEISIVS